MDLGTNYCYSGVLLALLRLLTQVDRRVWRDVVACLAVCSPDVLFANGRDNHSSWQAIPPARYGEGTFTKTYNAAAGERGHHNTSLKISIR